MAHAETRSDYDSQSERENTSKASLDSAREAFTKKVRHTRFMEVIGGKVVNDSGFKALQLAKLYDVLGLFKNLVFASFNQIKMPQIYLNLPQKF